MELSDIYYISLVREGDTDAFGHLVRKYQGMIFSMVSRMVYSHHDAEDITQEIFIKTFQSLNKFRGQAEFSTWLYRIAYNTAISEVRRKRKKIIQIDDRLPDTELDDRVEYLDRQRQMETLETILKSLPPEDGQLIMLYYFNKLSMKDIGAISGLSESNVKVRLHRIRNFINIEMNKIK